MLSLQVAQTSACVLFSSKTRALLFRFVRVHYNASGLPTPVLLDHHAKNIELAVQAHTLTVVALDGRMIGQNCDVSENVHLNVRWIQDFQSGTIRSTQNSEPFSYPAHGSICQNKHV